MSENERVTYDDKGRLDEIVGAGVTHLERMNTSDWFLEIGNADGTSTALWFKSKNLPTLLEKRDAPKRMTGTPSKDRAEAHMDDAQELLRRITRPSFPERLGSLLTDPERLALALSTAHRAGFAEGMKRAAEIAQGHSFGRDIDWWLNATKKDVSAEACNSVADAILAEIGER